MFDEHFLNKTFQIPCENQTFRTLISIHFALIYYSDVDDDDYVDDIMTMTIADVIFNLITKFYSLIDRRDILYSERYTTIYLPLCFIKTGKNTLKVIHIYRVLFVAAV